MSAAHVTVDLDDSDGLLEADRGGLLRFAAMAGAQVRATAAAVDEGALSSFAGGPRPRSLIWVAPRGAAESAGAILNAALGGVAGEPLVLAAEPPPWVGALDAMVVAGDDPGDPTLVSAAATAVRRGARVVVAAPYEGPLREATAGRAAVVEPRVWVPDEFGLSRYLAVGLAAATAVDPSLSLTDLAVLADDLDAEALRNSAGRGVFTNPAKALAERITGRSAVLAGDCAATVALARHAAAVLLRLAGVPVAAVALSDAVAASRGGALASRCGNTVDALFHDEEFDGPLHVRPRVMTLSLESERSVLAAKLSGLGDFELLGVDDLGGGLAGAPPVPAVAGRLEQLAVLAVRLEMAAVYLRLAGG
ncbi:MAG: TobH protein [Mycobacterium sp.]|nr:TobH protein [Mycobacterium sp.]